MNTLLQPDVCISEDYRRAHCRKMPLLPETALMLAVLEEAVATFQKFAFSKSLRGQNFFREADRWIRAEDDRWFFSFANICDLLGLDPAWIRAGLARWKVEAQASSRPIKRANLRRIVGNRFAQLGRTYSSPRLRVTSLAVGPRLRIETPRSGKSSRGTSVETDARFKKPMGSALGRYVVSHKISQGAGGANGHER